MKCCTIFVCAAFIFIFNAGLTMAEERIAYIPYSVNPVNLDGKFTPDEWSDAAILFVHDELNGTGKTSPKTLFYVKYDDTSLWVAALCYETDKNYPVAYKRNPKEDLSVDDSVQIVLGISDNDKVTREVLNMGGYAGAMGTKTAAADHYYQYTINAAGSLGRSYNETPLSNPYFTAKQGKFDGGWVAEFKIDFASAGFSGNPSKFIYANLFRYRPPSMLGWYLPNFGGYYPMPFGKLFLLAKSSGKNRTVEKEFFTKEITQSLSTALSKSAKIDYYPLSGAAVATIKNYPAEMSAELSVDGIGEKKIILDGSAMQRVIVDLEPCEKIVRTAVLKIKDKNGKVILTKKQKLTPVEKPVWLGTKAGIDYAEKKVPFPWTKPEIDGNKVKLLGKEIVLADSGLFADVQDKLGSLFAGSPEVILEIKGQRVCLKPEHLKVSPDGPYVRTDSVLSGKDCSIDIKTRLEFDGFTIVKLRVNGVAVKDISHLAVSFPLKKENAKFVERLLVQEIKPVGEYGYSTNAGPLWLGNEDKGLSFNYDNEVFFSTNPRKQVEVVRDGEKTWLTLNFVDAAGQVKNDSQIFRFFLQPTPTKPVSLKKIHSDTQWQWEAWSDWQGYPDLAKIPQLKNWADELHKSGQRGLLYTCQGLAENALGFKEYAADLLMQPNWIFYKRAYEPGFGVPCYACCKRGPEGELQLWAFDKLAREAGIDGIVSDGMVNFWDCDNPAHKYGCGRKQEISWDEDSRTAVVETRRFIKRMRGVFEDAGQNVSFVAHTGGGININTLSFLDGYMEGEQLARYKPGYKIPLYIYAVGYNGYPWGFKTIAWMKTLKRDRGYFWSLTYSLLHGNELEDSDIPRRLYSGFDDDKVTRFCPYWRPANEIKMQSGHSLMSSFIKSDETLVIVGNIDYKADDCKVDLSSMCKDDKQYYVSDILNGREYQLDKKAVKFSLESYKCVALLVSDKPIAKERYITPLRDTTVTVKPTKYDVAKPSLKIWEITPRDETRENAKPDIIYLNSAVNQPAAMVTYIDHKFGNNFYCKMRIKMEDRIKLTFGPVAIFHDSGWKFAGPVNGWSEGQIYQQPMDFTKYHILEIGIAEGKVDVLLDDNVIFKDMLFDIPLADNVFSIATWAGNKAEFVVEDISNQPTDLVKVSVKHPINP